MLKNQGSASIALIIIALLVLGGGYWVWKRQTPASPIPSSITSPTSTTTNDILLPYSFPVIDSISPTSGPLGTEIKVFGKNMVDARGDQNVAIVNDKGEIAYFGFGDASFERTYLRVKVDSRICKKRGTDATLPCSSWMTVIPGKYYIFIDHNNFQGHFESNKIMFTILRGTTAVDTADWKTYRNDKYGFEFKYPATWQTKVSDDEGPDYKVIARIVNPARAGKPDTDVPMEQFLVRSQKLICIGQSINLGGKTGTDDGWNEGFGLIYYRNLCFGTQGWPITIMLSSYDKSSQVTMDQILSTFRFTK